MAEQDNNDNTGDVYIDSYTKESEDDCLIMKEIIVYPSEKESDDEWELLSGERDEVSRKNNDRNNDSTTIEEWGGASFAGDDESIGDFTSFQNSRHTSTTANSVGLARNSSHHSRWNSGDSVRSLKSEAVHDTPEGRDDALNQGSFHLSDHGEKIPYRGVPNIGSPTYPIRKNAKIEPPRQQQRGLKWSALPPPPPAPTHKKEHFIDSDHKSFESSGSTAPTPPTTPRIRPQLRRSSMSKRGDDTSMLSPRRSRRKMAGQAGDLTAMSSSLHKHDRVLCSGRELDTSAHLSRRKPPVRTKSTRAVTTPSQ